jgi:hypothetical protein
MKGRLTVHGILLLPSTVARPSFLSPEGRSTHQVHQTHGEATTGVPPRDVGWRQAGQEC